MYLSGIRRAHIYIVKICGNITKSPLRRLEGDFLRDRDGYICRIGWWSEKRRKGF